MGASSFAVCFANRTFWIEHSHFTTTAPFFVKAKDSAKKKHTYLKHFGVLSILIVRRLRMKKLFSFLVLSFALVSFVYAALPQTTTEKIAVEGRKDAFIYITQIYSSEYWAEFFIVYEEPTSTFNEAETEKILYEFISNYKVEKQFSRVEVEDLEAARQTDKMTRVTKRVIFRQLRK